MGGKAPKQQTTTQKVEPWDAAKPYYETLYNAAQTAFQNTNRDPYTGPLYAQPNATQQQALDLFKTTAQSPLIGQGVDLATQLATQAGSGALLGGDQLLAALGASRGAGGAPSLNIATNPNASRLENDVLNGLYLNHTTNPYLSGAVQAATSGVQQNLLRNILPTLQDQSIAQGAYGGSGYGVAQGLATSDFSKQALDIANSIYYQNYGAERDRQQGTMTGSLDRSQQQGLALASMLGQNYQTERGVQLQAPQMLAAATQMGLLPAQLLDMAGSQQQSWDQAAVDAQLQRYNMNQTAPWAGLGEWAQILNGGGFSSTGLMQPRSPGASFLQGAAGTAGIVNSLFPQAMPAAGNWLANLFGRAGPTGQQVAPDLYGLF